MNGQIAEMQHQLEAKTQELILLKSELVAEIQHLQVKLNEKACEATRISEKLQNQVQEHENTTQQNELKYKQDTRKLRDDVARLKQQLNESINDEKSKNDWYKKECSNYRGIVQAMETDARQLRDDVTLLKQQLNEKINDENSKNDWYEKECSNYRGIVQVMESDTRKLRDDVALLKQQLNERINNEKSKTDWYEKEVQLLKAQNEDLKEEIKLQNYQMKQETTKYSIYFQTQQQLIKELELDAIQKADEHHHEIRVLDTRNEQADLELSALRSELQSQERKCKNELAKTYQSIQELERQCLHQSQQIQGHQKHIMAQAEYIGELSAKLQEEKRCRRCERSSNMSKKSCEEFFEDSDKEENEYEVTTNPKDQSMKETSTDDKIKDDTVSTFSKTSEGNEVLGTLDSNSLDTTLQQKNRWKRCERSSNMPKRSCEEFFEESDKEEERNELTKSPDAQSMKRTSEDVSNTKDSDMMESTFYKTSEYNDAIDVTESPPDASEIYDMKVKYPNHDPMFDDTELGKGLGNGSQVESNINDEMDDDVKADFTECGISKSPDVWEINDMPVEEQNHDPIDDDTEHGQGLECGRSADFENEEEDDSSAGFSYLTQASPMDDPKHAVTSAHQNDDVSGIVQMNHKEVGGSEQQLIDKDIRLAMISTNPSRKRKSAAIVDQHQDQPNKKLRKSRRLEEKRLKAKVD